MDELKIDPNIDPICMTARKIAKVVAFPAIRSGSMTISGISTAMGAVAILTMVIAWTMIPVAQLFGGILSDVIDPVMKRFS